MGGERRLAVRAYPSTRAALPYQKTPSGELWSGSSNFLATMRQTAFCTSSSCICMIYSSNCLENKEY